MGEEETKNHSCTGIHLYSDSSYATVDPERARSTTGTVFFCQEGFFIFKPAAKNRRSINNRSRVDSAEQLC